MQHLVILSIFIINIVIISPIFSQTTKNQAGITPGTLTFSVKTVTNNSTYSPRNVIAIWIKDSNGNFVVSRKVMANARKQHLVKWNASSTGNTVSATTGATLSSHQVHTVTWDGKNASGTEMPDGIYQIWVEYTSTNSASNGNQGPYLSVEFDKGPAIRHVVPANASYYHDIVADWIPLGVATASLSNAGSALKIYPNPFKNETSLQLNCSMPSQAYMCVYNASGQKVAELLNDSFGAGTQDIVWDGSSDAGKKLSNGLYFVHVKVNGFGEIRKVVINR